MQKEIATVIMHNDGEKTNAEYCYMTINYDSLLMRRVVTMRFGNQHIKMELTDKVLDFFKNDQMVIKSKEQSNDD